MIYTFGAGSRVPAALVRKVDTVPSSLKTKVDPMYKIMFILFIWGGGGGGGDVNTLVLKV